MIVAWLLFPLLMLAVCVGCGLLVEWLSGWTPPGTILISIGLAVVIVIATLFTSHEATTPFTTPVVVILALAGYVVSRRRALRLRPEPTALAAALGVFVVCAAPTVLSGSASFLGYFVLNDAVFHFALITQLLSHAHDLSRLTPPSAYSALLGSYLSTSYPIGADVALGALRPLVNQDIAWVFQPYLAVIMALGSAALYELLRDAVASRPLRALSAFVAAQTSLAYGYYLEASIKEIATAWIISVTVVLVVSTLRTRLRTRALLPLLVASIAGLDILFVAIAPWLAPPLAAFVLAALWRGRGTIQRLPRRRLLIGGGAAVIVLAAVAAALYQRASTFINVATAVLTNQADLGNLAGPLPSWEMVGIWPSGDFRFPPITHLPLTYALIGVAIASGVLGGAWTIRRRRFAPLLLLAGNGIAVIYLLSRASPYASAKVMMIFSITAMTVVMLGATALIDAGRRIEGWVLALVIATGVLASNVDAYHDASIAPRARLAELGAIGIRFSGHGPAFFNLSDEYATYFLRRESPTDPAVGPPAIRPGIPAPVGRNPWDSDDLPLPYMEGFRLFVIGNPTLASRPPANYRLAYQGRFYAVWRRTATPTVLAHMPLGGPLYPDAVPRCRAVLAFAAQARRAAERIAFAIRPPVAALIPTMASRPPNWGLVGGDPYSVIPRQQVGAVSGQVNLERSGRYRVIVSGQLSQTLTVLIDGRRVGTIGNALGAPRQETAIATVTLSAGPHTVAVNRPASTLAPGDGNGIGVTLGPVMLVPKGVAPAVSEVAPAQARSLCGRSLDWIEIVR